jgi:hypothetical protein
MTVRQHGRLGTHRPPKIPFFEWLGLEATARSPVPGVAISPKYAGLRKLPPLSRELFLDSADRAIRMHCQYFEWLYNFGMPDALERPASRLPQYKDYWDFTMPEMSQQDMLFSMRK